MSQEESTTSDLAEPARRFGQALVGASGLVLRIDLDQGINKARAVAERVADARE
jgi:hypothetical protein